MLKYLLSTVCIFLFLKDVQLNKYKCANPDCSKQIAKAIVKLTYPPKNPHEIYVLKGTEVYIHGFDESNYLVKVKSDNHFHLLPRTKLRENSSLKNAPYDVEVPFHSTQPSRTLVPIKHENSSTILDVFYSMIRVNESCINDGLNRIEETTDDVTIEEEKDNLGINNFKDTVPESKKSFSNSHQDSSHSTENERHSPAFTQHSDMKNKDTSELLNSNTNQPKVSVGDTKVSSQPESKDNLTNQGSQSTVFKSEAFPRSESDTVTSNRTGPTTEVENGTLPNDSSSDIKSSANQNNSVGRNIFNTADSVSPNSETGSDNTNQAETTSPNKSAPTEPKESSNAKSKIGYSKDGMPKNNGDEKTRTVGNSTIAGPSNSDLPSNSSPSQSGSVDNCTTNEVNQASEVNDTLPNKSSSDIKSSANQNNTVGRNISNTADSVSPNSETGSDNTNQAETTSPNKSASTEPKESSNAKSKIGYSKDGMPKNNGDEKTRTVGNSSIAGLSNSDLPSNSSPSQSGSVDNVTVSKVNQAPNVNDTSSNNIPSNAPSHAKGENTHVNGNRSETSEQENNKILEEHEPTSPNSKSKPYNQERGDDFIGKINQGKSREGFSSDDKTSNPSTNSEKSKNLLNSDTQKFLVTPVPEGVPGIGSKVLNSNGSPLSEKSESSPQYSTKDVNMKLEDQLLDNSEDSSQNSENLATIEQSVSYTDVLSYIGNFSSMFNNAVILVSHLNFDWLRKQNASVEEQHCTEENCREVSIIDSMVNYGLNLQLWSLADLQQSQQTSFVAGILLCTFLSIFFSILRNSKKTSRIISLISKVNQLEKKLLTATKEISSLEEQLRVTPVSSISQSAVEVNYEASELLKQQIEQLQLRNTDLEDKVTYLEKELHNVTTNAFEIHKLLENSLSTQAQSRLAEDEVDTLRALTERQERQIDELMKEMDAFVLENRYLKDDLKKMEKEFNLQTKKNLEISEKNRNLSLRFDEQIQEMAKMKSNYKSIINELQSKIEDLEISLRRSEFQVETLNRTLMDKLENKSDDQIQELRDNTQLKLQLSTLKAINNELSAELKEHKNARRTLDDHIGDVIRKCNELEKALDVSEKERSEAVNKLQVLTDYFKEKESQLQKEIAAKEKLYMESENKDQLLSQKLNSLKEEIKNNKDRNEELKKEIEAQESSFKTQLASAEQKSRDLYFALRQAERKYQESEKEAATLRNKILILENNLSSVNQKLNEKHSSNGDINGQALMFSTEMLSYRGPTDFIPPPPSPDASHYSEFFPPEPSYSPDERLPPLGGRRVPSPPSVILPLPINMLPPINIPPPEDDNFKPPVPHTHRMSGRRRHESYNMSPYYGENSQYN